MTPTEPDDLARRTTEALGHAADQMSIPTDGFHRVEARVRQRRRHRTVRASLAGLLSLIVLVGGVVVFRSGHEEQSVPVVAGPETSTTRLGGLQPLAPAGIDWYISSYSPPRLSEESSSYAVSFPIDDRTWSLRAMGPGSSTRDIEAFLGLPPSALESVRSSNGRAVSLLRDSPGSDEIYQAWWVDPTGVVVQLTSGPRPGTQTNEQGPWDDYPTLDQVLGVVSLIQPVEDRDWVQALLPAEGTPDPESGVTSRPLRLGLHVDPGRTALDVNPWLSVGTVLAVDGFAPETFHLRVTSDPRQRGRADGGDRVTVRGVEGRLDIFEGTGVQMGPGGAGEPEDKPFIRRSVIWDEGGSTVELSYEDGATVDDAVAVANSLVVLDDASWLALLFPGAEVDVAALLAGPPAPTTSTPTMPTPTTPTTVSSTSTTDGVPTTETGPDGAAAATEYCVKMSSLGEVPESYVGSAQHIADIEELAALAPEPLKPPLQTYAAFLRSGAIKADDPTTKDTENWPPDIQAAVGQLMDYTDTTC